MIKWSLRSPVKGDIIRCEMGHNLHHYGIFISDEEIIEFGHANEAFGPKESVVVKETNIKDFLIKGFLEVREYSFIEKIKKNKTDIIIKKARDKIGSMGYDIINNNCEHFVNECVFNKHISDEVSKFKG